MMNDLTVCAVSLDITDGKPIENISRIERCLTTLSGKSDIVVLPELCTTGFVPDKQVMEDLAEDNDEYTITTLRDISLNSGMHIAGSFLATDHKGMYYNRAFILSPDGHDIFYDKHHLFILSPESKLLTAGNKRPPIKRIKGWNVAICVCYDLRFPTWLRNTGTRYDLLLIPANWPESRKHAWETLLMARAIENVACVVGANRSGHDSYGSYDNLTYMYDWLGNSQGEKIIVNGQPAIISSYKGSELTSYRQHAPFLSDAD